jgi:hypothetical protein
LPSRMASATASRVGSDSTFSGCGGALSIALMNRFLGEINATRPRKVVKQSGSAPHVLN